MQNKVSEPGLGPKCPDSEPFGFLSDTVSYLPLQHQCEALTPSLGRFSLWVFHPGLIKKGITQPPQCTIQSYPIPNAGRSTRAWSTHSASTISTTTTSRLAQPAGQSFAWSLFLHLFVPDRLYHEQTDHPAPRYSKAHSLRWHLQPGFWNPTPQLIGIGPLVDRSRW